MTHITNEQYLALFNKEVIDRECLPLPERKKGFRAILEAIEEEHFVDHIIKTVDNILTGSYGIGVLIAYSKLNKRRNKKAWLIMQASAIEYVTSIRYAKMAYKRLSTEDQEKLNTAIDELITDFNICPTVTLYNYSMLR